MVSSEPASLTLFLGLLPPALSLLSSISSTAVPASSSSASSLLHSLWHEAHLLNLLTNFSNRLEEVLERQFVSSGPLHALRSCGSICNALCKFSADIVEACGCIFVDLLGDSAIFFVNLFKQSFVLFMALLEDLISGLAASKDAFAMFGCLFDIFM